MHRYSSAGSSSGVGNNSGAAGASRETRGSDSSFTSSTTFSLPTRRANQQLVAYKLKCEREPLSTRLGPPDFYPPAPNCAEEVLNRDSCVNGYKEIIDGVEMTQEVEEALHDFQYPGCKGQVTASSEFQIMGPDESSVDISLTSLCDIPGIESNEAKLSLTSQGYNNLWNKQNVNRYKEAIRKRLRALNNALVRRRKAGQVYGVPLGGSLLAKPGSFPEQRTYGDDFRKKWIEKPNRFGAL